MAGDYMLSTHKNKVMNPVAQVGHARSTPNNWLAQRSWGVREQIVRSRDLSLRVTPTARKVEPDRAAHYVIVLFSLQ